MLVLVGVFTFVVLGFSWQQSKLRTENQRLQARDKICTATLDLKQRRYDQTLRCFGDAIIIINLEGYIESINEAAERLTGWSVADAVGKHYKEVYSLSAEAGVEFVDRIAEVLNTGLEYQERCAVVLTNKGKKQLKITEKVCPLTDEENKLEAVLCIFRDLTRRELHRQHIEQLTFKDSLTGLYNRAYFSEISASLSAPGNLPLSIIVGDLNGLKITNDLFGHNIGDELIKLIGEIISGVCRPEDLAFRWGGDEFVLFLPRTDLQEAEEFTQGLAEALMSKRLGVIQPNMSLGVATRTNTDEDLHASWQRADEEMYWNKTVGRSAFQQDTLDLICSKLFSQSVKEKEHAERVSTLAVQFGDYLGLAQADLHKLRDAGYFHDIGKAALNPELLHKSYPLSSNDQHEMRRHPLVGFRLLNFFDQTVDLAEAVLAHHERWDGAGYPKGLAGNEIPLLGRILAIVETYDRVLYYPHGQACTPEVALQIISAGSGLKFDPDLATMFLSMIETTKKEGA